MKTKLSRLLYLLLIPIIFQCSDEFTRARLSKEELRNEIINYEDFKTFISYSASNQIALSKVTSQERGAIEDLSNKIIGDYYQNSINKDDVKKYNQLISWFSSEPIEAYSSLVSHISMKFYFSESDLIELLSESVNSEIQRRIQDKSSATAGTRTSIYIDVCGVVCAIKTEQSGLQDSSTDYARTIFYSGCYVGCVTVLK